LARGVQPRETALAHTFGAARCPTTAATSTTTSTTAALVKKPTDYTLGDAANTWNHPCGEWKCGLRHIPNR
jgi:hypothetical protein